MPASTERVEKDPFACYTADMLLAIAAPCLISVLSYGWSAAFLLLTCALTALLCAALSKRRRLWKQDAVFSSALFAGLALAMLLPAGFPLWKAALGTAFAVLVAAFPFGGAKYTPFSPAAAGFVFLSLTFPKEAFACTSPAVYGSASVTLAPASSATLASMLQLGESVTPNYLAYLNILIGNVPAAIGTSCMAVLAGVSLYVLIRRTDAWITSASFVTVCALAAVLFPRVLTGRKASLLMELSAGALVFAALFLLPHPAASPETPGQRLLYGGIAGALCMALRRFGSMEESACTAVLLMECLWPAIKGTFPRRKKPVLKEAQAHAEV